MQGLNLHMAADRLSDYHRQIPQILRWLMDEPGLKHAAFVAHEDGSAFTMILLVWNRWKHLFDASTVPDTERWLRACART